MSNKISVIIDVVTDKANQSLGSFKKSIQDADGAAGKFKAGAAGAFDAVKANAGTLAVAAGAALVTFGTKAVSAFRDTAIEAGRMSDALGLPVEDMSRLIEVAGDLGVEASSLEQVLGRMNQTAGKSPAAFEAIGAEIVKTESGATDVNATFLETVDALNRIEDPAKRAAAAQQIFGRSWRDSAELIGLGGDQIARAMAKVSDAKVIDDDEVRKAREFRERLDELGDAVEDIQLAVGEYLVPTLTDMASAFITVRDAASNLGDILPEMPDWLGAVADKAEILVNPIGELSEQINELDQAINPEAVGKLGKSITDYTPAVGDATDATGGYSDALDENTDVVEGNTQALKQRVAALEASEEAERQAQSASLSYRQQVADTAQAVNEATLKQLDATLTDEERAQAARDAEAAVLAQADAAVKFAEEQAAANGETFSAKVKTQIYIDELTRLAETLGGPARAEIEAHIARLRGIPKSIATNIEVRQAGGYRGSLPDYNRDGYPGATGGIVTRPTRALIGEAGPEAVIPLNRAPGASPLPGGLGGATFNVTINADPNPDVTVRKLREWVRRNGPIQGIT